MALAAVSSSRRFISVPTGHWRQCDARWGKAAGSSRRPRAWRPVSGGGQVAGD
jgi:hypothetical protein